MPKETTGRRSVKECRVLVIDDNPAIRLLFDEFLTRMGIKHLEYAEDGKEGLEKANSFMPDMIILDFHMPNMNGLEMLKKIRSSSIFKDIPVIVETVDDTYEARSIMFDAGATDFITNPVVPKEFYSRVRTHLENRLLVHELETQLSVIEMELFSAQHMQLETLPSAKEIIEIKRKYGISINHHFEPSSAVGGDFWGLIPIDENAMAVYICDFSGHGVSAALNTFRLHTILKELPVKDTANPAAYMNEINQHLCKLLRNDQFATFFFGIIDISKDTLIYSSAGVPNPVTGDIKGNIEFLDGSGLPLGISRNMSYENITASFSKDSFLFLYSDAFTETPYQGGKNISPEAIVEVIKKSTENGCGTHPLDIIMETFFEKTEEPLTDDLTTVWLCRK